MNNAPVIFGVGAVSYTTPVNGISGCSLLLRHQPTKWAPPHKASPGYSLPSGSLCTVKNTSKNERKYFYTSPKLLKNMSFGEV